MLRGLRLARQYSTATVPEWLPAVLKSEGGGYLIENAGLANHPVEWGQQDRMGHINNVQYLKWFESARVNFLKDLEEKNLGTNHFMSGVGVGPIMRSANIAWRYPIVYPDNITVLHKITKIDEDRYTSKGIIISHKAQKVAARIEEVLVTVDYDKGTVKAPVPEAWRKIFEDLMVKGAETV